MTVKERARQLRAVAVAKAQYVLDVCDCEWPVRVYRNGSGHHTQCRIHQEHLERNEEAE